MVNSNQEAWSGNNPAIPRDSSIRDTGLHVLIVEESEDRIHRFRQGFASWQKNHRLSFAQTLSDAQAIITVDPPDIACVNPVLPDGDGTVLLTGDIPLPFPLIICTNQGTVEQAVQLLKAGAVDYRVTSDQMFNEISQICEENLLEWERIQAHLGVESDLARKDEELQTQLEELKEANMLLQQSESRFHQLFLENVAGYALHEIICDATGTPVDYRFLEINPAFERLTGLHRADTIGKTVKAMLPQIEPYWIETYGRVALTGESVHFENFTGELEKYYEVTAYSPVHGQFATLVLDITERKNADAALHKSEERLRLTLDAINDGFWDWNIATGEVIFSPRWYTMIGYEPDELPGTYATWRSLIHPEDLSIAEQKIRDNINQKSEGYEVEIRMRTKEGAYKWILTRGKVVLEDAQGIPIRMVGTHTDISERKNIQEELEKKHYELLTSYQQLTSNEEELKQNLHYLAQSEKMLSISEERLVMAQEIGHVGSWEYTMETDRIWGSAEGFRIYGYPPVAGDIDIAKIEACIPEQNRVHQALVDLITLNTPYDLEFLIIPADGAPPKIIHSIARVERDAQGIPLKVRGVIQDVTDLKKKEESLRETNAYLENLINSANVPIIVWDPSYRITRTNRAFELLSGRSAESLVGNSLDILFPHPQVDRAMRLIRTTLDGVKWETVEMDIQHMDGSIRTIIWNSSTLYTSDGVTPVATIAQGRDVTDQRRLEQEKDEALIQVKKNLAQLAILNDEIRNPLTVITLNTENISDSGIADAIIRQIEQIDNMIRHLDQRWMESEKVLGFLQRHHKISFEEQDKEQRFEEGGKTLPDASQKSSVLVQEIQAELYIILDSMDAMVYVADMETHELLFMNRRGRSLFGDVIGKKCYETIQQDQNGVCSFCTNAKLMDASDPTGVYQWEFQNTKNGRWFDCRDRAIRWVDGRIVRLEIATDITGRKQTEEQIRKNEETYRLTLEATNDGLWDWNISSGTAFFSPRYYTMLGYEPGEFPATFESWKNLIHPEDQDRAVSELVRQIQEKRDFARIEYRARTKSGEWIWMLGRGKPVAFDEAGNVTRLIGTNTDITQIKQAEESIQESTDRYWKLVQSIPDYILVHRNGKILFVNKAAAISFGYTQKELIGSNMLQYLTPKSQNIIQEMMKKRISREQIDPYEIVILTKDGRERITEVNGVLIQYEGGMASLNVLTDVTKQKQILEELKKSEEKFRSIFDMMNDGVHMHGIDADGKPGKFIDVNEVACTMVQYSREEMLNHTPLDFVSGYHNQFFDENFRELMTTGHSIFETEHKRKDGSIVPVEINSHLVTLQGKQMVISVVRDITTRKQIEEALKTSEGKYRQLVEHANEAIVVAQNGMLQLINPRMVELTGYTKQDLLSLPFSVFIHPDDQAMVVNMHHRRMAGENPPSRYAFRLVRKDTTITWVEIGSVVVEWEGSPATLNFLTDITERKQAEEALRESNKKLRLLTSLTRHDIFNQLSTAELFADLALNSSDLNQIQDYVSHAKKANERIETIIGFTRDYEDFGVISSSWQNIHRIIESAKAEVSFDTIAIDNLVSENIQVYADPIIRKIFTTLIENSIRHGEQIAHIRFSCQEHEDSLLIVCEDDGVGIPEAEKERIFDHGYGKHTGIGLFLAREILSITGLSIRECGEEGKGARFEITVPANKFRIT